MKQYSYAKNQYTKKEILEIIILFINYQNFIEILDIIICLPNNFHQTNTQKYQYKPKKKTIL